MHSTINREEPGLANHLLGIKPPIFSFWTSLLLAVGGWWMFSFAGVRFRAAPESQLTKKISSTLSNIMEVQTFTVQAHRHYAEETSWHTLWRHEYDMYDEDNRHFATIEQVNSGPSNIFAELIGGQKNFVCRRWDGRILFKCSHVFSLALFRMDVSDANNNDLGTVKAGLSLKKTVSVESRFGRAKIKGGLVNRGSYDCVSENGETLGQISFSASSMHRQLSRGSGPHIIEFDRHTSPEMRYLILVGTIVLKMTPLISAV